jgi:hypothetical protein
MARITVIAGTGDPGPATHRPEEEIPHVRFDLERAPRAPSRSDPRARVNPMMIIIVVVIVGAVLILGVLVGASIHRELSRRERRRLAAERMALLHEWEALDYRRRISPGA